jgi:serine/threonine protein kinase
MQQQPLPPLVSLRVYDDVTLEDEATGMKTKYRAELGPEVLTLYAALESRNTAGGAAALEMRLPLHAFARPERGGGGLLGQGLANPFWIRAQVNTGTDGLAAAVKLTFAGRRGDRDEIYEKIANPPAAPPPSLALEERRPLETMSSAAVLRDMNNPERQTNVSVELRATELWMRESEASESGDRLDFHIPLESVVDAVPSEQNAFMGMGKTFCIELRHRLPSLSPAQPPARTRLDFPARPERDHMLAHLRSRRATATASAAGTAGAAGGSPHGSHGAGARSGRRMSVSSCVPSSVQVMTTIKAGDFTVYVLKCVSAEDGHTWQVQKRFSEFETLRKLLTQLDPKIHAVPFPEKSLNPFSSTNAATVAKRREDLEIWSTHIISLCSPQNAMTRSPLHVGGGHDYVASFFAPEDADLQTDSPRLQSVNRASTARMSVVALPSDTADVEASMSGMLRLLPNVTQELLLNYCGGAAKQGWMFKEGEHHAGWQRRWFILWPEEAHPSFGRLLIYFETPDAAKAKGAIQILAPVVKAPKTPRAEHFCIRLNAKKIHDARDLDRMKTQDRKFILGTADEQSVKEWIELFRASGPAWKPNEVEPDCCSWLMKKGTGTIGWWKKRWVELRGSQLIHWEGNAGSASHQGKWELENYVLHFPTAETRSRPNEFVLLPKVDTDEEGTVVNPVFFSADSEEDYSQWKACLQEKMEIADHAEAEQKLSLTYGNAGGGGSGSMRVSASSRGPEQSPEDFDVMNVLGKGGFGKVLLVKKKGSSRTTGELMAMKMMDKAFIVQQQQQQHTIDELNVMKRVQHPFMIALYNAFQNDASLFLVMEFMQGGDLYVTMQGLPEKKFSEAETQFIAAELCLALCHLHDLDIAFRDLKPENVLFDLEGHVRLIDFGLAKENISDADRQTVCGTPIYMSPESVRGMEQPGSQSDHPMANDWWAFGTLIYEMVFGTSPFTARSFDSLMAKIAKDDVSFPVGHSISPHCIDIIQRLLNKREAQRLGSEDSSEVQRHDWFSKAGIDFAALYRKELQPVFVPEAIPDDPLAHFPTKLTEQVVDKSDFQAPAKSSALMRTPSRDEFAVSNSSSSSSSSSSALLVVVVAFCMPSLVVQSRA